jgi:hypothetical protein
VPVDDEPEAPPAASQAGGEQGEVRERSGVHDVVVAAVAPEVAEHAPAELEGRRHTPVAVGPVQLVARGDGDHAHPRQLRRSAVVPLAPREVRDPVALGGEPLAEIAVPPLGTAHGPRVEAVVDQADVHGGRQG